MMSIITNHAANAPSHGGIILGSPNVERVAKKRSTTLVDRSDRTMLQQQTAGRGTNNDGQLNFGREKQLAMKSTPLELKDMATSVAAKWNLTTPNAAALLEKQFYKENDWDPKRDFFHFHHLYKSGGTSMSNLLDKTVGLPRVGKHFEGILPGSYQSGDFNHEEALEDIHRLMGQGIKREDLPYRASYAHTGLWPVYGPKKTKTGAFLLEQLPHKRLRAITMLRDPTDFRASNHAMIMCGLNYEVTQWNMERGKMALSKCACPRMGLI